jgi:hypothetical protein
VTINYVIDFSIPSPVRLSPQINGPPANDKHTDRQSLFWIRYDAPDNQEPADDAKDNWIKGTCAVRLLFLVAAAFWRGGGVLVFLEDAQAEEA